MKPFASLTKTITVTALLAATVGTGAFVYARQAARALRPQLIGAGNLGDTKPFVLGKRVYKNQAAFIASGGRCGTPEPTAAQNAEMDAILQGGVKNETITTVNPTLGGLERVLTTASARSVNSFAPDAVTIPVYVHVVAGTQPEVDAVKDARIAGQIDVLNRDYAGKKPKPAGQIASDQVTGVSPYRFQLISIDRTVIKDVTFIGSIGQLGGVDVVLSSEYAAKSSLRKGKANALNIYLTPLANNTGLLGYATFPTDYTKQVYIYDETTNTLFPNNTSPITFPASALDGVVVEAESVPGGSFVPYDGGETSTHEIGHWMGLYHTFQPDLVNYDPTVAGCVQTGDFVADTPAEQYPYFGPAPATLPDTCGGRRFPGRDPYENFMDYSDDAPLYQFTPYQVTRMNLIAGRLRKL